VTESESVRRGWSKTLLKDVRTQQRVVSNPVTGVVAAAIVFLCDEGILFEV
jgi:hypothetical protein